MRNQRTIADAGLRRWSQIAALGLTLLTLGFSGVSASHGATDESVAAAIDHAKAFLYRAQDQRTGRWTLMNVENSTQRGGDTALVVAALIASGETYQNPRLRPAIEWLKTAKLEGTYAVALRTQVWASLPDEFRPLLDADTRWLLAAADAQGRFRYVQKHFGDNNHSATHVGVLALWAAARRGAEVPASFWKSTLDYWISVQDAGGGWGYTPGAPPYGSMTAAGLSAVLIAQQRLHRDAAEPDPATSRSADLAMRWIDERFDARTNPGGAGNVPYYLYALERAALAGGVQRVNRLDWFASSADYLIERQHPDDGSAFAGAVNDDVVDTAFALLFLARGRVPVWASKLTIPGVACNQRPNDLNFLTEYLSDMHEGETNWQRVSIDSNPEEWLSSPLLYLAADQAFELSPQRKASLRRYLDLGGTLLASPDHQSKAFAESIKSLATELYPRYPVRPLPQDHRLFSVLHPIGVESEALKVQGVSNGARELILLVGRDLGAVFQTDTTPGNAVEWKFAANLWATVTDRGVIANRLVPRYVWRVPPRDARVSPRVVEVARVLFAGNCLPEPLAWEHFANVLHNRAGVEAKVRDVNLEKLGESPADFAHMTGILPHTLTAPQAEAIKAYVARGGTLLVETVGGQGDFAADLDGQLGRIFPSVGKEILGEEPVISGKGIDGGYDLSNITYRRFALRTRRISPRVHLIAYMQDGRPAVLVSRDDLTQGMMGLRHWGIQGYEPESARRIVTNLVLASIRKQSARREP